MYEKYRKMLEDEKKILIEEPKAEVKKAGKDVLEMTKLAGYFIGKFFWSIALLIWECFSWIAYKRMRIPRLSFLVEVLAILIPTFFVIMYFQGKAVMAQDKLDKEHYVWDTIYRDSLIRTEFAGWERGKREVLDSIKHAKEDAEEEARQRRYQQRIKAQQQQNMEGETESNAAQ